MRTRKIAVLVADGVDDEALATVKEALLAEGAVVDVIAPRGIFITDGDVEMMADHTLLTVASVLYDAVYVPGGTNSVATLEAEPDAIHFLNEAFKTLQAHCSFKRCIAGVGSNLLCKEVTRRQ